MSQIDLKMAIAHIDGRAKIVPNEIYQGGETFERCNHFRQRGQSLAIIQKKQSRPTGRK